MRLFPTKSAVGLDLGHAYLKAVQIEPGANGWRVARIATAPTPVDAIKDGVVVDAAAVGAAISRMLREAHIGATQSHIAAAGGAVFVRPVTFPRMNEASLRKTIRFEASRYVPGSIDDSYVEFEILGPVDEANMEVLIVAAPRDVVDSRVAACELAGLEVESVDVETFAMHRALCEIRKDGQGATATALVDIGACSTCVGIVDGGVFAMNRSIPQGGKLLTDALAGFFKLSDDQAEEGKAQLDLAEMLSEAPRENPPLRIVQPHVDDLVREVRRSLNYFQSHQVEGAPPRRVTRLVLAGGGARMPGLAAYLSQRLGIPAEERGVFDGPEVLGASEEGERGVELAVACGLAMRAHPKALSLAPSFDPMRMNAVEEIQAEAA